MLSKARLAAACRHVLELEEALVEDVGAHMAARLREAGLALPGRYSLTGSWANLWVEDGRILRAVEPDDMEARVCRALEGGPLAAGDLAQALAGGGDSAQDARESGGLRRALRYLERSGYILGPSVLLLTQSGLDLAAQPVDAR
jgi:hypothetical protein